MATLTPSLCINMLRMPLTFDRLPETHFKRILQGAVKGAADHPHCFLTKIQSTSAVFSQLIVANKFDANYRAQIELLRRTIKPVVLMEE